MALGLEDPDKGTGRDRVYGLQENAENWDEIRRKLKSRITEPELLPVQTLEVACTLRDGRAGSIELLKIGKSQRVHSIVDDGTYSRLEKGNKELTATEINDLCFARGTISSESELVDVDFELLDTDYWQSYATRRRLTRSIDKAMYHLGLAKKDAQGQLRPTKAAVLLFAEQPSGLLGAKTTVRVFHYRGASMSTDPNTNLAKPPTTIGGPLIQLIRDASETIIRELGQSVQHGPLGFEIVQRYPVRVIKEAITNAVIHRDYRLPSDVIARIFSDRVEIDSPGLLVGPVTTVNIQLAGTHARNPLIVQNLREFPTPPNLDGGKEYP